MKYIGSHKGTVDDGYIGSGKRFENARRKYGIENFERTIVEYVEKEECILIREQYYLDTLNCAYDPMYYNISPNAGGGDCGNGLKISITKKERFASGELVIHNKGKPMEEEQRIKLSDTWEVITPLNEVLVITNMRKFCCQNNLNPSSMSAVARGARSNYKGYRCKKLTNNRSVEYQYKEFVYLTPEERSQLVKNVARRGIDNHESVKIEYDGVIYNSISEAKQATGKSYYLITKYGKRI